MLQIIIAFIVIIIAVILEGIRESSIFKIKKYSLETTRLKSDEKPLTLVFLSDLHNHVYHKDNQSLLLEIKKQNPDYILIGGDMLIGKHGIKMEDALKFCAELPKIAPVYYALGNHEQRMKEDKDKYGTVIYDYIDQLKFSGITFLENETEEIKFNQSIIHLTGLAFPIASYERPLSNKVTGDYVKEYVGTPQKNGLQILLAHNPTHFKAYKEWGADLVFSGHLHGGVARIPGWRGVITPKLRFFPKYSGEMTTEDGHTIIVSKGLGTHTIPFRIFNYPEAIVLEVYGKTGEK